ncbi:toxin [Herbaspirillum sp. alder98]|uniref:toxin n=1 Tax=Herbaspirillum sp. alder98 TaxID=2913096 RepID=UPI001CD8A8FF|nr:toxin [Herbaspirillum sp. alder98]MCA1326390.1 toxin [Herbaspirillum sp. alder98]
MRYIVVGTSGAGKSTFAQALAKSTKCPYVELDELYWGENWQAVSHSQFESAVDDATVGDRWVADGNYSAVRELLWSRATHVIWLNYDKSVVFPRVIWRTISRGIFRTRLSHGNRESLRMAFLSRDSILLWAYTTFEKNRHKFSQLRADPQYAHLHWNEFQRPVQAEEFLNNLAIRR